MCGGGKKVARNWSVCARSTAASQLDDANAFLEAVLTSLRAGVAVLNRELQIQAWNRRAEDLWGLRREEAVGEHFLNLDIGLPTDQVRPLIRQALTDGKVPVSVELDAVNRRGRSIRVRIECSALVGGDGGISGAVLVMEDGLADGHRRDESVSGRPA